MEKTTCAAGAALQCDGTGNCSCVASTRGGDSKSSSTAASKTPPGGNGQTQAESYEKAAAAAKAGGDQSTAVSVLLAADAFNSLKEGKSADAGVLFDESKVARAAAEQLKQMETQNVVSANAVGNSVKVGSLLADPRVLAGEDAQLILGKLEENYALTREEFTSKILSSNGDLVGKESELSEKLKPGVIADAMDKSAQLSPEARAKVLGESKAVSLRDRLRARMSDGGDSEAESSAGGRSSGAEKKPQAQKAVPKGAEKAKGAESFEGLANDHAEFFSDNDSGEFTLFDVVHRKYQERARFFLR